MGRTGRAVAGRLTAAVAGLLAPVLASSLVTGSAVAAGKPRLSWTVSMAQLASQQVGGLLRGLTAADGRLRLTAAAQRPASLRATTAEGILDLPPRELPGPVDRISAALDADLPPGAAAEVEARGRLADGRWTEWSTVSSGPALLAATTHTVQLRVLLRAAPDGASPVVRLLRATAEKVTEVIRTLPETLAALTFRVYATQEGLVGGTTANGHVIVPNDHFVALPSRRALSPNGKGDYTVKVCAANGRCEWAPVWDGGPWNTADDHWNPPAQRQNWKDLAQGLPEAQAARLTGYNRGRDQFGRLVTNPAGVDLADGTFLDGLAMSDNGWVTVSYLWIAAGAAGQAHTYGTPLAVRNGPGRGAANVGYVADQAAVTVECQLPGDVATGTQGTSDLWYRIGPGQYAARAWITGPPPRFRPAEAAPPSRPSDHAGPSSRWPRP